MPCITSCASAFVLLYAALMMCHAGCRSKVSLKVSTASLRRTTAIGTYAAMTSEPLWIMHLVLFCSRCMRLERIGADPCIFPLLLLLYVKVTGHSPQMPPYDEVISNLFDTCLLQLSVKEWCSPSWEENMYRRCTWLCYAPEVVHAWSPCCKSDNSTLADKEK